jgi:hypothetical protein
MAEADAAEMFDKSETFSPGVDWNVVPLFAELRLEQKSEA